jgi:lipoprotein-releasing system ATP-binding protein
MNEAVVPAPSLAPAAQAAPVLDLRFVTKTYGSGETALTVLKQASFTILPGQMVALVGPSGSGKSTLLHIAGLLDRPSSGEVWIRGRNCAGLADDQRSRIRRELLGFVYQYHHLLPEFTALENVILPQLIGAASYGKAKRRAQALLDAMGLKERESHRPSKLSGGEQQRVAVARAMANKPSLLLADEPTGNLDTATAQRVFALLQGFVEAAKIAALVATHNLDLARRMTRMLKIQDGVVVEAGAG